MKQFFITLAGVFAGLLLFFVVVPLAAIGIAAAAAAPQKTPNEAVLVLDLRSGVGGDGGAASFLPLANKSGALPRTLLALHRAEQDPKIKAVFVRLPDGGIEPATADELAQAFARLRKAGKIIYAHSQGLYASGAVVSTYRLGAAADALWMQPGAPFEAVGMTSEDIFFKRFFDKFGVTADYEQRGPYKNAVNPYLFADYTPQHREAQLSWMNSVFDSTLAGAAADRGVSAADLKAVLTAGPYDADQALAKGLISKEGQVEETQVALLAKAGQNAKLMDIADYQANSKTSGASTGPIVAIVNVVGEIVTGDGGASFTGQKAYSDQIARALYACAGDDQVKAVVLRVSSPGGADTGSEQIAAAVRAVKKTGKPVVVSMGDYAASGGYWVSAEGTTIIAEPTTITGSIGVYGGKFSVGDAVGRYGVDVRELTVGGDYAAAGNLGHAWTPSQRAAESAQIDRVYQAFINHVAGGRHMTPDQVRAIADGRVWTGAQAVGNGLVDSLGGLNEAIDKAKSLAKIPGGVHLRILPEPPSAVDTLKQALGINATSAKVLAAASVVMGDARVEAAAERMLDAKAGTRAPRLLASMGVN
jgi:protease-4